VRLHVLPGRRADDAVRDLQTLLGPEVTVERVDDVEAVEMPHPTPLWDRIADSVRRVEPDAALLPGLSLDAWDAATFGPDVTAYGFTPLSVVPDDELSLPVDGPGITPASLRRGVQAFLGAVLGTCVPEAFPMPEPGPR